MPSPFQKNPTLSAFFRTIDRADELGSGMRKLMLWGKKYGGEDPQLIEGDNFRMILAVPEFGDNPAKTPEVVPANSQTPQVADPVGAESPTQSPTQLPTQSGAESPNPLLLLLRSLEDGEKSSAELRSILSLSHRPNFRANYLHPALEKKWIEYTLPDKPNSRLQKYRLTEKGRDYLRKTPSKGI